MKDKELYPVKFTKKQIDFIKYMLLPMQFCKEECNGILSTIEKSAKEYEKIPTKDHYQDCSKKSEKCYHVNIRFNAAVPDYCPDCHINVWPSDMINVILDSIHHLLPGPPHRDRYGGDKE